MTRNAAWAVGLGTAGLVFDGYDLVVYGALVPLFLRSPGELGALTPATAGALGSYALAGVLVGALAAGAAADRWGRRPVLLTGYAWFSAGMAATALTSSVGAFGAARLLTGVGIGIVVATTGALVSELAPPGRRQLCTTVAYCGIPLGSVAGTLAALALLDAFGWRGLFWIGALPLVTLLPLAVRYLPESPAWLANRGTDAPARASGRGADRFPATGPGHDRRERRRSDRCVASVPVAAITGSGFGGLFRGPSRVAAALLGLVSAVGLLLVFALGTWLPELLGRAGFDARAALVALLVLNGGAVAGALLASPLSDRFGPRRVVACSFAVGSAALLLVALQPPAPVLLALVALAGLGTTGTQILVIGLATATFDAPVRGAGVAWCTGFGRLGGIAGPLVVGLLVAGGLGLPALFALLAALAVLGAALTLLVRTRRAGDVSAADRPGAASRSP